MKRREFLKASAAATAGIALSGTPLAAMGKESIFGEWLDGRSTNGKIMVFIFMAGGNDGLNMVIPLDRYSELSNARPNLLIPATNVLGLTGQTNTGLHPAMTGMQALYNSGKLNIIQGVSYPNNSYSHFKATDIYMSGKDANVNSTTGWLGRALDTQLPGAAQAYPNASFSDPLAIEIGSSTSLFLAGINGPNGMSISNISNFYNIVNNTIDPAPNSKAGNELSFLRYINQQTNSYNAVIQQAATLGSNLATYPNTSLANKLKIVANLISGGMQTPFYIVRQGGYDTHSAQVDSTDPKIGKHADLLGDLSDAISAFQSDLQMLGKDNDVAGMTISEFGRRIIQNASTGTDHGRAAPAFVFGKNVNPTILGTSPVLPANATVSDQVPMQNDFQDIYASVLHDWMGLSTAQTQGVLDANVAVQPIFCPNTSLVTLNNPCFLAALSIENYTYFTAVSNGCSNKLTWGTRDEENVSIFEIERSDTGTNFEKNGEVVAFNEAENNYVFEDWNLDNETKEYQYRLKAIDNDNHYAYSIVRLVNNECSRSDFLASAFPNPASNDLNIILNTHKNMKVRIEVVSVQGRKLITTDCEALQGRTTKQIDISTLPKGMYMLRVINKLDESKLDDIKFIKN